MNNRTLLTAILAALILPISALAATATVNGIKWTYSVAGGEATVEGIPDSTRGAIKIPAKLGGYPVGVIGDWAFYGCRGNVDTRLLEERDKNRGVTMFVARCYTKALNRNYDVDGLNHWCTKINSASNKKATAIQVAKSFLTSAEFQRRNLSNSAFVDVLYRTFLDRNADAAGKNHWVSKLNSGVSRNTVMAGFYNSAEFNRIMAGYGIR